jgi:hypothetical protein
MMFSSFFISALVTYLLSTTCIHTPTHSTSTSER